MQKFKEKVCNPHYAKATNFERLRVQGAYIPLSSFRNLIDLGYFREPGYGLLDKPQ